MESEPPVVQTWPAYAPPSEAPPRTVTTPGSSSSSAPSAASPMSGSEPAVALDPTRWKRSCPAQCAETGKRCKLPAHASLIHASGAYRFQLVAAPGQTFFPKAAELEQAALTRTGYDEGKPRSRGEHLGLKEMAKAKVTPVTGSAWVKRSKKEPSDG
jgi:hypothetical protein